MKKTTENMSNGKRLVYTIRDNLLQVTIYILAFDLEDAIERAKKFCGKDISIVAVEGQDEFQAKHLTQAL